MLSRGEIVVKNIQESGNNIITILMMFSLVIIFLLSIGLVSAADSSIIYVNDSGGNDSWDGQYATWQDGTLYGPKKSIKNATGTVTDGGTVNIANGIYGGTGNTNVTIDKNMAIIGQSQENTIIDGTNTASVFSIQPGINVTILNLTFVNGNATEKVTLEDQNVTSGGAIFNAGNLTVFSCTFISNTASWGGAIGNIGTMALIDSNFIGNNAHTFIVASAANQFRGSAYGGAIYNYYDSIAVISGCNFTNNYALNGNDIRTGFSDGGAIYNCGAVNNDHYAILAIFGSNFINNTATGEGGAIFNWDIIAVNSSTFAGNHAQWGGAISSYFSADVSNCTFTDNTATGPEYGYGGAIENTGNLNVDDSVFLNNTATTNGGAINNGGACNINGSSFVNNTATGTGLYEGGGAIHHLSVNLPLIIRFTSFFGNNALKGYNIHCLGEGTILDANYNWWGTNNGPNGIISSYGPLNSWPTTWLVINIIASPSLIDASTTSTIITDLTHDNRGTYHNPTEGHVLDGIPVNFATTFGTITSQVGTVNGAANATLSSVNAGLADVSATVDSQTVHTSVSIDFSISQIVDAAQRINKFIETNQKLPTYVTIGGVSVNMARFLHLAVQATYQINTKNNTPIALQNDNLPGYLEEQLNSGSLSLTDYLDFARRISGYMDDNHQAPPYGFIGLGKIGYQSQVYLYTRILSIYNTTGSLPSLVTVKPFNPSNIPILYTPPVTFTPVQIVVAAVELQNTIESTKSIPNTVTVNGITVYTAQFLHLATQAITQLKNNNNDSIVLQNDEKPGFSEESLKIGTMTQSDYLDFAQRINGYMNDNRQAPPYGYVGLGKVGYQSQVYLFTRILGIYNSTGSLPSLVTVKPFNPSNIPILYTPPVTFTPVQIVVAAVELQNTIESTKSIPNTVTVNGITVYTAQFLHLATQAITQLKNNNNDSIVLQNDEKPGFSEESLKIGTMTQSDYLDFAQRINGYMNDNRQAPPYGYVGLGKVGYQSQVYLFTRILGIYNSTGSLPAYVTMKPWSTNNIPIIYTPPVTFTPIQIVAAAVELQNTIESTKSIPNTVTVNGITVYTAQFLHLATQAITQLKNNNNDSIVLQNDEKPGFSEESLRTGTMTLADYVDFAQRITSHMDNNHQAPPYGFIGLGKVGYQSQVYLFTRVLTIYNSTGSLPAYVTMKPWSASNIPIVYTPPASFTSDQIVNASAELKNTIETTKTLPGTVVVGGITVSTAQFLHLAVQAISQLNGDSSSSPIQLQDDSAPSYSEESLSSGSLSQASYVDFAQRINGYMNDNHQAPPYGWMGLGKISYKSQIYLFARILSDYKSSGSLIYSITVKSWSAQNIPIVEPP
nr:pseudomurein-binding repeat-containing protein [uncultured Methanobacterium sp.]